MLFTNFQSILCKLSHDVSVFSIGAFFKGHKLRIGTDNDAGIFASLVNIIQQVHGVESYCFLFF